MDHVSYWRSIDTLPKKKNKAFVFLEAERTVVLCSIRWYILFFCQSFDIWRCFHCEPFLFRFDAKLLGKKKTEGRRVRKHIADTKCSSCAVLGRRPNTHTFPHGVVKFRFWKREGKMLSISFLFLLPHLGQSLPILVSHRQYRRYAAHVFIA